MMYLKNEHRVNKSLLIVNIIFNNITFSKEMLPVHICIRTQVLNIVTAISPILNTLMWCVLAQGLLMLSLFNLGWTSWLGCNRQATPDDSRWNHDARLAQRSSCNFYHGSFLLALDTISPSGCFLLVFSHWKTKVPWKYFEWFQLWS